MTNDRQRERKPWDKPKVEFTLPEARNLALKRLGSREYGAKEMAAYLKRKGVKAEDIETVVADLVSSELINDRRYARVVARSQVNRGKGSIYVMHKLRQKGVKAELSEVKELVSDVSDVSEVEAARQIVERKYPGFTTDRNEAQRAYQALLRRGFTHEIARQVVLKK